MTITNCQQFQKSIKRNTKLAEQHGLLLKSNDNCKTFSWMRNVAKISCFEILPLCLWSIMFYDSFAIVEKKSITKHLNMHVILLHHLKQIFYLSEWILKSSTVYKCKGSWTYLCLVTTFNLYIFHTIPHNILKNFNEKKSVKRNIVKNKH